MTDSLLENAIKKRASIIESLKKDKLYQELMLVEGIIEFYGKKPDDYGTGINGRNAVVNTRTKTMRDTVDDLAVECIESNNGNASKSQISEHLASHGIQMSNANLAAYLSGSERVDYDGEAKAWVVS